MKKVLDKIAKVRAGIGAVDKNGRNDFHKYKFQAWEDVLLAVRVACDANNLLIFQSVEDIKLQDTVNDKGKKSFKAIINYKFTLADAESGETIELFWVGEGDDNSDKSINKAGTSAYKYFCLKQFQITTKDEEDPDSQSPGFSPPQSQSPGEYRLPITGQNLTKVQKYARDNGVDFDAFVEACKAGNVTSAVKAREILDSMVEVENAS